MKSPRRRMDPRAFITLLGRQVARLTGQFDALRDLLRQPDAQEGRPIQLPRRAIVDIRSTARAIHREADRLAEILSEPTRGGNHVD